MPALTAYGGVEEIGGNRLLLETHGTRLMLDFGTSFRAQGTYFDEYLQPRKLNALGDHFRMGLAPDIRGVYRNDYLQWMGRPAEDRGVDGILLTHAHLDHAGLFPYVRPDIPLYMSEASKTILAHLEQTSPQYKDFVTYFEEFRSEVGERGGIKRLTRQNADPVDRPVVTADGFDVGEIHVESYPVDHSLPGARGYIIQTPNATLAYTGDFRFHGRDGSISQTFAQRLGGVDVLLTEGTNVRDPGKDDPNADDAASTEGAPSSEDSVHAAVSEALGQAEGFVAVSFPPRDLDRLLTFHEAARKAGRRLLVTPKQWDLLERFRNEGLAVPGADDAHIGVYLTRRGWGLLWGPNQETGKALEKDYTPRTGERELIGQDFVFTAQDIRHEPSAFLPVVDQWAFTELVDLDPAGGHYIYSKTEPFNEEMEIDQRRLAAWCDRFGLDIIKAHASGHASWEELQHMVDEAGPKRVVPVHTEYVRGWKDAFGDQVLEARLAQAVQL